MRISLRVALIALVVGLLAGTAHWVGSVAYFHFHEGLDDVSRRLFSEVSKTTQVEVQAHIGAGPAVLQESLALSERGLLPVDDLATLGQRLALRLWYEPSLDELTYGDEAGGFVAASRVEQGPLALRRSTVVSPGVSEGEELVFNAEREVAQRRRARRPYDPRERNWYLRGKAATGIAWTEVYPWTQGGMGISCVAPVRRDGALLGVLTADIRLDRLNAFLGDIEIGETGRVFLLDATGTVIAGPQGADAARDVIARLLREVMTEELTALPPGAPKHFDISEAGVSYAVAIEAFEVGGGLRLATAVVVPKRDFLGRAYDSLQRTIVIAAIALLLALALGVFVSSRLATPMTALAKDLRRVGRFELDGEAGPESAIHEIQVMRESAERMKASLRSFGSYVPTELVRQLVAEGRAAELGGEHRELTLFFSDIAGFTGISEQMPVDALVAHLGDYLTAMGEVLDGQGATIDKFMGDGILAFFNAPRDLPKHARAACHAALESQRRLVSLREAWAAAQRPELHARIGLHTGEVIVGNIGTPKRFDYTVIGDAVNVASRLEGLNKVYGTSILISEATRSELGEEFELRRLDKVAVVGRRSGLVVYELLGVAGEVVDERRVERDAYEAALERYFERDFSAAQRALESILEARPQAAPARVLLERARLYEREPPPESWSGVFQSRSK